MVGKAQWANYDERDLITKNRHGPLSSQHTEIKEQKGLGKNRETIQI